MGRATYQLLATGAHKALASSSPGEQRTIYTARNEERLPGVITASEGANGLPTPTPTDKAITDAYDGLGATYKFYWEVFGRNSIDDEGLHLDATVHYGTDYLNAFWNGQQMVFGDGDQVLFAPFTSALDVIGHELTHGVTGDEAGLIYTGQSGALNESISDVFGSLVDQYKKGQTFEQAEWLIGADLLIDGHSGSTSHRAALRSMAEPGTAYDDPRLGKDPQPAHMKDFVHTMDDNGGVHINSGIPNKAFFLVAKAFGGKAWEKAGQIWYATIRDRNLRKTASFRQFAHRTHINAGHLFGSSSVETKAVLDAWQQVGVNAG